MGTESSKLNTTNNSTNNTTNNSLGGEKYTVQIHSQREDEGSIDYMATKESLDSADGFFSFTFYIRDSVFGESTPKDLNLYLNGLNHYRGVLDKEPFLNWKMLIYTDGFTYNQLRILQTKNVETGGVIDSLQEIANNLLTDPRVVLTIVTWPKHQRKNTEKHAQINGGALRTLRARAPFDFPTKYVFIRDADTFDEFSLTGLTYTGRYRNKGTNEYSPAVHRAAKNNFTNEIFEWEKKFYELIPSIQEYLGGNPPLILGTGYAGGLPLHRYKREWHSNELLDKDAPYGVFAGLVSVAPGVPVYQNYDAWDEFIEYIDTRSVRNTNHPHKLLEKQYKNERRLPLVAEPANLAKFREDLLGRFTDTAEGEKYLQKLETIYYNFSNNGKAHRLGRDEQFYLFIIMPKAIENIYIYNITIGDLYNPPRRNNKYHTGKLDELKQAIQRDFVPVRKTTTASSGAVGAGAGQGGGKRKTLRMKFEKRKTRKHSK